MINNRYSYKRKKNKAKTKKEKSRKQKKIRKSRKNKYYAHAQEGGLRFWPFGRRSNRIVPTSAPVSRVPPYNGAYMGHEMATDNGTQTAEEFAKAREEGINKKIFDTTSIIASKRDDIRSKLVLLDEYTRSDIFSKRSDTENYIYNNDTYMDNKQPLINNKITTTIYGIKYLDGNIIDNKKHLDLLEEELIKTESYNTWLIEYNEQLLQKKYHKGQYVEPESVYKTNIVQNRLKIASQKTQIQALLRDKDLKNYLRKNDFVGFIRYNTEYAGSTLPKTLIRMDLNNKNYELNDLVKELATTQLDLETLKQLKQESSQTPIQ